ncbi:MAG: protein-export chaperone SecB [Pseudomonadota bacterium]
MSDTPENGAAPDEGTPNAPEMRILAQYVKDLSFESPNAPQALRGGAAPQISVNVDVSAKRLSDNEFEVELSCSAKADIDNSPAFIVETTYAGVFQFSNLPQEALQPALLIEAPRMLFPFARRIVGDATRDGGFPPLMLDPIDFVALYQRQMAAQQQAEGQADA